VCGRSRSKKMQMLLWSSFVTCSNRRQLLAIYIYLLSFMVKNMELVAS